MALPPISHFYFLRGNAFRFTGSRCVSRFPMYIYDFSSHFTDMFSVFPHVLAISPHTQLVRSLDLHSSLVSTQTLQLYDTMTWHIWLIVMTLSLIITYYNVWHNVMLWYDMMTYLTTKLIYILNTNTNW